MIVQRGYKQPPSFHIDRLRAVPDGYFFDVITNGFGVMPSYARAGAGRATAGRSSPTSARCSSASTRRWPTCPDAERAPARDGAALT